MNKDLLFMFNNLKNAQLAKKSFIFKKQTKISQIYLKFLWFHGYILGYSIINNKIKINLKYYKNKPTIKQFKLISKPTKNLYISIKNLWKLKSHNFLIFSTNLGLKSLNDCQKNNLGGKLLFIIN
jgi:ribosomal protein S8